MVVEVTDTPFVQIGVVHSCFKEKFGIPRQAGVASEARATVELFPPFGCQEALQGLEGFSHLWIIFEFHQAIRKDKPDTGHAVNWRPTVRPPRLGGNRRIGVFASRSPFRPNPIGLSAVALDKIEAHDGVYTLQIRGADLLDGTPVLDIKPYLPYADAIPDARGGYASAAPEALTEVRFHASVESAMARLEAGGYPGLRRLIEQVLSQDPRPAYLAGRDGEPTGERSRRFGMRLYEFDVQWRVCADYVEVLALNPA